MKNPSLILLILLGLLAAGFIGTLLWLWPRYGKPHVVARAVAPDGTELRIIQKYEGELHLLNTSIYVRHRGGWWNWFYYDHEDLPWRWGNASVDLSRHLIVVRCEGRVTATYDYGTQDYHLLRADFPQRTVHHGQDFLPPGKEPPGS